MRNRLILIAAGAALAAGMAGTVSPAAGATTVRAASLDVERTWSVSLPADTGAPVINSSPTVATLDGGGPSVVVGDGSGRVWAFHVSNGSAVAGWPKTTADAGGVNSPISAYGATAFAGVGSYANPSVGGYEAFGATNWFKTVQNIPGRAGSIGLESGLSVGDLQGGPDVFAGSLGQNADAFSVASGATLAGFPFFQGDSDASTAAIADLYSNGQKEIVYGGASTAGLAYGVQYVNGGHLRVLSATGQELCNYNTNEVVSSSPAVGEFLSGGAVGITVGTSDYYKNGSNYDQLLAFNTHCGLQWATTLDGVTNPSPALVDALGNGGLQIAETAHDELNSTGTTYLINGANGKVIWDTSTLGAAVGGPVSVDLGGGYQDLVVTGTKGVQILDGKSGVVLWQTPTVNGTVPLTQNSALVTDDPNGTVGITVAGYNVAPYDGQIAHFEVTGSHGSRVTESGGWPEFHHDPQLTGDAGTPTPKPIQIEVPCRAPATPAGYLFAASDGGIFNYGNLPFCGSTGSLTLAKPIVGMAMTPDGGGYWLVASDGGIFAFGDAHFYGSTGNVNLAKPIVAMAPTPDGKGYWLVASDGGIFNYGDAHFYGSTGNARLAKPIVGMAPTFNGKGYWLVASDGGIFNYGNAHFHGSTGNANLSKPIVAMAPTHDGGGYWLVASDGGIFNYGDAHFYGSAGKAHLTQPVVGMAPTHDGKGYWFVTADGGILNYGDANFFGSANHAPLSKPIVTIAGF